MCVCVCVFVFVSAFLNVSSLNHEHIINYTITYYTPHLPT